MDEVRGKADAVNASKLDKTVADATKILNDSKGRVEDDKVRAALEHAIRSRDGKAISDAVKAVNDSIKAKSDADANARAEKEKQAAENTAQAPDNGSPYTGGTTGGHTGYTGGGYTQSQGGGYTYTPQQPTGGSTGGGYTPTPQPQPQQPSQGGGNGGGSTEGATDMKICVSHIPLTVRPQSRFPAVNLSFSGARATHPILMGCAALVFYGTVVSVCLFSRSRMRRIGCLRIRSIG